MAIFCAGTPRARTNETKKRRLSEKFSKRCSILVPSFLFSFGGTFDEWGHSSVFSKKKEFEFEHRFENELFMGLPVRLTSSNLWSAKSKFFGCFLSQRYANFERF